MKSFFFTALFFSMSVMAGPVPWSETFKLPEGMTYRARAAGYDCGTFGDTYVSAPSEFITHGVEYRQLAADKDLNKFLVEATFPAADGKGCVYGIYLDRNREDRTLDFNHSEIVTTAALEDCQIGKEFLDLRMKKISYEASKRGIRYIATQLLTDEASQVCESGTIRIVFDRRFVE